MVPTLMETIVLLVSPVNSVASVLQRCGLQPKWPFKEIKFLTISIW